MNESTSIGEQLASATRWEGESPELWAKSLEAEGKRSRGWGEGIMRLMRKRSTIAAAVVVLLGLAAVSQVAVMQQRSPAPRNGHTFTMESQKPASPGSLYGRVLGAIHPESESFDELSRVVVRKATIEIRTPDVRGAFAKISLLVSEARGEFVQDSTLTGGGVSAGDGPRQPMYGTMTLRVDAKRLGEVMNSLRGVGTVTSENSGGEDITTETVDIEARLRNEKRVEEELLELLKTRQDAQLAEIMEVRTQLGKVRQEIEQLTSRRDHLARLASLATVLVIVQEDVEKEQRESGAPFGAYFTKQIEESWNGGLRTLSDGAAWVVRVLVGGAIWWALLAVMGVGLWRWARSVPAGRKSDEKTGA